MNKLTDYIYEIIFTDIATFLVHEIKQNSLNKNSVKIDKDKSSLEWGEVDLIIIWIAYQVRQNSLNQFFLIFWCSLLI